MNANTRLRLWKEARALLPMWAAMAVVMVAPRLLMDRNPLNFSFPAYWLSCALLGAAAFSQEFQYRTVGLLLAQPVSRRRVWWEKYLIVGTGVVGLLLLMLGLWFTDAQTSIDRDRNDWGWILLLEITPFFYAAFIGLATGPVFSLLTRSLLGGAIIAIACPWILFLISWFIFPASAVGYRGSVFAIFNITFVGSIYCGMLFLFGCRLFQRLQDVSPVNEEFAAPRQFDSLFARLTVGLAPERGSMMVNLVRKELRVQRPAFFVAAVLVALWLILLGAWRLRPEFGAVFLFLPAVLLGLGIPTIAGIVAVAEERSLGVHEWHLTLPVSARRLWTVKVLVALGVNVAFGILLPGLLAHASSWLANNPQLVAEIPGRNVSPLLIANAVIFCAALYASTVSANSILALVGTILIFLGGAMVLNFADYLVTSVNPDEGFLVDVAKQLYHRTPSFMVPIREQRWLLGWSFLAVWLYFLGLTGFRRSLESFWQPVRRMAVFFAVVCAFVLAAIVWN